MRIFDLPLVLDSIRQDLEAGLEPDPAKVNLLTQEGPTAIEGWIDMIEETQAGAAVIAQRIKELRERKEAYEATVERMKGVLAGILTTSFDSKVKTPLVTCWVQDSKSYEFVVPPSHTEYWKPQESKLDKAQLIADVKAGKLAADIIVTETVTPSLRVRR